MREPPERVPLLDLLTRVRRYQLRGDPGVGIGSLTPSSRSVHAGALYFSVPSERRVDAVHDAVRRGAVAIVTDRWMPVGVPQVRVPSVVRTIGTVASEFFGRPHERLSIVGVTGTNGKSTTVHLLHEVFTSAGLRAATIGTSGYRVDDQPAEAGDALTTPEAIQLQALLARLVAQGIRAVAMEVTSHALANHRVDGVRFGRSIFTNLSPAHLDFHGTFEGYFEAKARLFTPELTELAVLNVDHREGVELARREVPCLTYGTVEAADVRAEDVGADERGIRFRIGDRRIRSRLRGAFNVGNCLAAFAAARSLGIDDEVAVRGIGSACALPGRMETFTTSDGVRVVHDAFNANPASLIAGLTAARELAPDARLAIVLGTMAELGSRSADEHEQAGRVIARSRPARVVAIGPEARRAGSRAARSDASTILVSCTSADEALEDIRRWARPGDTVYLKGSRVAGLDAIATSLR